MAKRSRQATRNEGRSYSSCLCLFGAAILLGLAGFQLLDFPLALAEPRPKIASANVAALLQPSEAEVVVTGPPVPAPAPPVVSVPAVPPAAAPVPAATAAPVPAPAPGSSDGDPEIIWYSLAPREPTADIDLVIAAFSEDLSWIDEMMAPVASSYALRLYCKGDRLQDPRCLRIHNFGGEEYAYLTHITHFYDDLAPITIFTLGSIYDNGWHWLKCRKLNFVLSYLDSPEKRQSFSGFATMAHQKPDSFMEFEGYFKLDRYRNHAGGTVTDSCRASVRPLEKWFETFIYNVSLKKARHTGVLYNPIFAVSRERIRQYPKSMYERLLREILRCTSKAHEGVAEAGHYLERAWKPMFESDMPDAIKCSGHFGQKKGDEVCCNQSTPSKPVRIELPWTICREGRPLCSGMVDGSGWGTCMPADLGERVDLCPESIRKSASQKKHAPMFKRFWCGLTGGWS